MKNVMETVCARIREIREICGFSQKEIADGLQIPLETYQKYEQNASDIPISVLYHISSVCKVDLNEILTGVSSHIDTLSVVRSGNGMSVDRYPGYNFENLAYNFKHKIMEPLLVTVQPHDPVLVTHGGQEFNMVLEGVVELLFDNKCVRLNPGDCVYFNPVHPHGHRAIGEKARFLTVITE